MMATIGISSMRDGSRSWQQNSLLESYHWDVLLGWFAHKDSEGPCIACRLTPTAYVIGWGGRSFKPRLLSSFFFSDRRLGLERWLPPRAFVLGVALSALLSASSFFLFSLLLSSFLVGGFVFLSLSFVGAVRFFLSFCFSCSCLLLVLMSWGGFVGVGGYVCCGVCVFSSASPCFKESPRGAPLCMQCLLLLLLSRPLASCPYVVFVMLVCF